MVENFAWGQEWQFGYHKHPPFFAWVTALWFKIFPNMDWAYFLLSQVNVIVGFIAIWFLARMFLSERQALIAVVLLELVPFYTFLSFKFNANAILLSLWPLTALFFCHAYSTRRFGPSLVFGILAALALLSKYYSFCLLAALFLISILCKERRQYYTSFSPYVSVVALLVIAAPHLFWLFSVDFLPFGYATSHIIHDPFLVIKKTGKFAVAQLLYLLPMALAFVAIVGERAIRRPQLLNLKDSKRITIFGITFFPFLLTIGGALVLQVELSSVWGLPIWFFIGASYLTFLRLELATNHVRRALAIVFAFQLLIISASPLVALAIELSKKEVWTSPRKELAAYVSDMWHQRFGKPLRIVAGSKPYADSITFYSADHPSLFINFDFRISPWISPERLRAEGLAIVCLRADQHCLDQIDERFGARGERIITQIKSRRSILSDPEPVDFVVVLIQPGT
ncbi:MAG: glycosyltransferase family 39 protein [Desulfobacterales bacterium]